MDKTQMRQIEDYFEFFLVIFFILLFLFLLKGFFLVLFFASALVFLTYPLYIKLKGKVKSETVSALLVMILILVVLLLPIGFVASTIYEQSDYLLASGKVALENIDLSSCGFETCRIIENEIPLLDFKFENVLNLAITYISNSSVQLFSSLTLFAFNFLILILSIFFLLKDGDKLVKYIKRIVPLRESHKNALFLKFRDVSTAVFINNLFIAALQGFLTGVGLWLFGISNPLFWGIIAAFFALIPFIGPTVIWLPAAIYLLLTNELFFGIGLIIWGALIVGLSDNFGRPLLLKDKIKVHPLLIFLGILGGIDAFGIFMGIFIGPIIVSFLVAVLDLYKLDFR